MNDTYMTIVGNVVSAPKMRLTKSGHAVANFRVASTSRRYDTEQGRYVDNSTLFVNVTCWRAMAENVAMSLQKGQPVVVTGRYFAREYEVNETLRVAYDLEANAVGHDLARGTSEFRKVNRPGGITSVPVDENGVPVDDSEHWLDLATGEVVDAPVRAESEHAVAAGPNGDDAATAELAPVG